MNQRYAIVENGLVVNVALAAEPLGTNWIQSDAAGPGWTFEAGEFSPPVLPAPTPEELKAQYRAAIQAHIDATAQSRSYDSGSALAGYVNSTVAPWRAEAEAFIAWRDAVWLFVFEKLAQVETGDVSPPNSTEAMIALLPAMEWPNTEA
jgi:hypothetical protein